MYDTWKEAVPELDDAGNPTGKPRYSTPPIQLQFCTNVTGKRSPIGKLTLNWDLFVIHNRKKVTILYYEQRCE